MNPSEFSQFQLDPYTKGIGGFILNAFDSSIENEPEAKDFFIDQAMMMIDDVICDDKIIDLDALFLMACIKNIEDLVVFLVKKGANINARSKKNSTALMFTSHRGYYELTEYLIKKGIDVDAVNNDGNKASSFCANDKIKELID